MAEILNTTWLIALLLVPLLYYFYSLSLKKRKLAAIKFSNLEIIKKASKKTQKKQKVLFYLSLLILLLIIIGLSDPHIPLEQTKEGVNVILAIDVSGSMQATDYSPTRLEAAKRSAEILLNSLKPKDNAGIVLFESGATTASYLSPFKDRVIDKLRSISPKEGRTAIGDGLSLAVDMALSIPNKKKVIILLSDGVNNAGVISPGEAVAFAKVNNIQVNTVGMGSDSPVVLGYDWFGNPQYAELDEATLKSIASETGGKYFKSVNDDTLDEIYKEISEDIKREKELTSIKDWFFIAALIVFLLQLYLRYGKGRIIQ